MTTEPPTVCGLPLTSDLPDGAVPLAAVVIVRILDEDGDVAYVSDATPGLTTVEALGMVGYADVKLRQGLADRSDDGD